MNTKLRFPTIWARIEHRMAVCEINQADVARRAGWKNDANLRNIKSGRTRNPKSNVLAAIARVLKTTEAWLREEEGPEELRESVADQFSGEAGAALVEEAQANARRLTQLVVEILNTDRQVQDRIIRMLEGQLSGFGDSTHQTPVRSRRSKSRG